MLPRVAARRLERCRRSLVNRIGGLHSQSIHSDARNRLSSFWTPTQRPPDSSQEPENGYDLLVRAGFLRQAHAGVFHLLPLGLRVQNKVESLIDKHMTRIDASKVSLSSISSETLWQRSGRFDKSRGSEFLTFEDRKGSKYLLSPTHEEEITTIVAESVHSYKDLPLRLYQVSRKYRDEPRPRQGLLRAREFVMKDLYTFDATESSARATYEDVRKAYAAFFEELRLPYLVATADSGNMGGNLSHEYHFASPLGEDTVISCNNCDYIVNEEKYTGTASHSIATEVEAISMATFLNKDGKSALIVLWPGDEDDLNIHAVKKQFPGLDTGRRIAEKVDEDYPSEPAVSKDVELTCLVDPRIPQESITRILGADVASRMTTCKSEIDGQTHTLTKAHSGDKCPQCENGSLSLQQAVEIGHTFHLGTRYSVPLEASVTSATNQNVSVSMGCHGIGISRLISAASSLLADERGLNWPLAIAPFPVVIVPASDALFKDAASIYDLMVQMTGFQGMEPVIDDRQKPLGWKLNDAHLIGYPFVVVLGRAWKASERVELHCRRLGLEQDVELSQLPDTLRALIDRL